MFCLKKELTYPFTSGELEIIDMGTNNTDPIGKAVNQGSASLNPI